MSQEEIAGVKFQHEKEKVTSHISCYDDLIANYVGEIKRLNGAYRPDEVKSLIQLLTESVAYCEEKRTMLINYLNTLNK